MGNAESTQYAHVWRQHWLLVLLGPGSLALLFALVPPLPQDPAYHAFADARTLFGITNALDVLSNLPFLVVGLYGVGIAIRRRAGAAWLTLFVGVTAVSAGSAWYHVAPDSGTLVWDRLPMTVGFMGLFTALLAEYVHPTLRHALIPMVLLGAGSVFWWAATDDLRLYGWVQFMPLAVLPVLVWKYRPKYTHRQLLFAGLGAYVAAKVTEHFDALIFATFADLLSGHTLKHLLAAAACLLLAEMIRRRVALSDP